MRYTAGEIVCTFKGGVSLTVNNYSLKIWVWFFSSSAFCHPEICNINRAKNLSRALYFFVTNTSALFALILAFLARFTAGFIVILQVLISAYKCLQELL